MKRRQFIQTTGLAALATTVGTARFTGATEDEDRPVDSRDEQPDVAIQLSPWSVFDEGVDRCLDLLQETAGINILMPYVYTYSYYDKGRRLANLAPDHGNVPIDPKTREMTKIWVRTDNRFYKDTRLRHGHLFDNEEFAGRDLLDELIPAARKRGMRIYARFLAPWGDVVRKLPGWADTMSVDADGKDTNSVCRSHPDYVEFQKACVADLFSNYPLDGLLYGSERGQALSGVLGTGVPRICFCEHCQKKGQQQGIDVERARIGVRELVRFTPSTDPQRPSPGNATWGEFWRLLVNYPEILAWDKFQQECHDNVKRQMYATAKRIAPQAKVGWHIFHHVTHFDFFCRAINDYDALAEFSDYLKPVVYADCAGPRMKKHLDRMRKGLMRDFTGPEALTYIYRAMGHDPEREPAYHELMERGFSPEYVHRETKRCVDAVAGKCAVWPGIGVDIPVGPVHRPNNPELLSQSVRRAFDAGATGLVVSRESDEMRVDSLKAVGLALHQDRGHAG